jgi:hypothetical protein
LFGVNSGIRKMGDKRRFDLFAKFINRRFPDKNLVIADVAGGKGGLQLALLEKGYKNVLTFDKRYRRIRKAKIKMKYKLRWFDDSIKDDIDLVVGMHPDGATDYIIVEAGKRKVPFIVCPCCIKPDAVPYNDKRNFNNWYEHLKILAHRRNYKTEDFYLKMRGKNKVLIGIPKSC